jgi:hypothetical protein
MSTTTEPTQLSINHRWMIDSEIERSTVLPTQLSINDRWLIDSEIERLSVFESITNSQRSTLNPTAEPYVPNTPPSTARQHNDMSLINDSQ